MSRQKATRTILHFECVCVAPKTPGAHHLWIYLSRMLLYKFHFPVFSVSHLPSVIIFWYQSRIHFCRNRNRSENCIDIHRDRTKSLQFAIAKKRSDRKFICSYLILERDEWRSSMLWWWHSKHKAHVERKRNAYLQTAAEMNKEYQMLNPIWQPLMNYFWTLS